MTERQIRKWLRKQFSGLCWVLIGYFALLNTLVSIQAVIDILQQTLWNLATGGPLLDFDMDALMSNGWGYAMTIVVGMVTLSAWKGPGYLRQEIFHKERKLPLRVFFCMVIFCMGCQMTSSFWMMGLELVMNGFGSSIMPMLESVSGGNSTFSMVLYSVLLAPISEEILFRGLILRSLRPYGRRFAILGSALLFGMFHGNLIQGPYAFLMGLILGWIACEYSIYGAFGLHVFNNLVLAEGLTRLTERMSVQLADAVHVCLFGGSMLASLAILINKRHEIQAYHDGEWIDRRCVLCFFTNGGFLVFAVLATVSMVSWFLV